MNKTDIAKVAHNINRAFCQSIGDNAQPTWEEAEQWYRDSSLALVDFHIENPEAPPSASHDR
jgi:hypothetical protein